MIRARSFPCTSADFADLSTEILKSGLVLRFKGCGVSMVPLVRDGDVLLVRPVTVEQVRIGDVVLFHQGPGRVLVHRVIRRLACPEGARFLLQGDNVGQPDGVIPGAQIHGRLAAIERAGAQIDMNHRAVRWLGRLAVLRSRWNVGGGRWFGRAGWLLRKLPGLRRYLV